MNTQTKQRGFSIIEVVLVLAIAGLIFLMVFIALPALQRNQRDSARQTEVQTVLSAVSTYGSQNSGRLPTTAAQIGVIVNGKAINDTEAAVLDSGAQIQLRTFAQTASLTASTTAATSVDTTVGLEEIVVVTGAKCPETTGSSINLVRGTSRQVAVVAIQESGGATGSLVCRNN